jgi:hypothetical protein
MTREEKAHKLGQEYFPSANNIWARPNFEAQWVYEACMKMAEWERKRLVDKACKWLKENVNKYSYVMEVEGTKYMKVHFTDSLIEDFKKAIKE